MPKTSVISGFNRRGWDARDPTPDQVFTLAAWLGVGYASLITHMHFSLRLLTATQYNTLRKITPKSIRETLVSGRSSPDLVIVDRHWTGRPIDANVDDLLVFSDGIEFRGTCCQLIDQSYDEALYRAVAPGIGETAHPKSGVSQSVRIARANYVGLTKYRHLEG